MRVGVIGGGVIGLATAHYLRSGGAEVVVMERDRVGHGCSLGNGGWICPSISTPLPAPGITLASLRWLLRSDSPLYIKPTAVPGLARWLLAFRRHCDDRSYAAGIEALGSLTERAPNLYRDLAAGGVSFEWSERGMIIAHSSEASLAEGIAALERMRAFGAGPFTPLDREQLRRREPALTGGLVGGVLVASDAHARPETLCDGLAASLADRGVELLEGRAVMEFATEGARAKAARCPDGDIDADAFVIAAGAESGALTAGLGHPLPVQAGKGYSITVERPAATLNRPAYIAGAKMGFTPFDGAIRTLGTLELSGINLRQDPRRIAILERAARRFLPGALEGRSRTDWVGMRPVTPDGLPAIGPLATFDNVFVATGHQMLGITLAPATGHALAQRMLKGRSEIDLAPFDPARFSS